MDGAVDRDRDRDRVKVLSNRIERSELKPGDHIYTWRAVHSYAHHGIYVGDNKVIHFTRAPEGGAPTKPFHHSASAYCQACAEIKRQHVSPANGDGSAKEADIRDTSNHVRISCLDCFLRNRGQLYLHAYEVTSMFFISKMPGTCTMARSDPPEKVLHRAFYLLKHGYGKYNLFNRNCEDFCIYCKTELVIQSYNITGLSNQIHARISTMYEAGGTNIKSIILSEIDRYQSDIGVRKDTTRVPVEMLVVKAYE